MSKKSLFRFFTIDFMCGIIVAVCVVIYGSFTTGRTIRDLSYYTGAALFLLGFVPYVVRQTQTLILPKPWEIVTMFLGVITVLLCP